MLAEQATIHWTPSSESERAAVRQQLEKLLATSLFSSSKRYPSFLNFVVSRALAGQYDQLKERILGVEIFGRPADYDTNADPIVRVTAAEIRKRVEQYYQDPRHSQEIRLFLPAGSYAPQFSFPGRPVALPAESLEHVPELTEVQPSSATAKPAQARQIAATWKIAVVSLLVFGLLAGATGTWYAIRPSALKQFWAPIVSSSEPVLFCLADQSQYSTIRLRDAANPQKEITLNDSMVTIIVDDVSPLANMAGLLRTYGRTYRVSAESTTTLTDLRRGPSVFIGAYDNSWTLRLTAPLRFHFANDPAMTRLWIEDKANPDKRDWVLDRSVQQQTGTYKDYAIVARFVEPNTDQYSVVAAGIGRGGTVAAGEFLVDAHHMESMLNQAPSDWKRKNLELVLETQVIEGRSGPPHVSAVHVW